MFHFAVCMRWVWVCMLYCMRLDGGTTAIKNRWQAVVLIPGNAHRDSMVPNLWCLRYNLAPSIARLSNPGGYDVVRLWYFAAGDTPCRIGTQRYTLTRVQFKAKRIHRWRVTILKAEPGARKASLMKSLEAGSSLWTCAPSVRKCPLFIICMANIYTHAMQLHLKGTRVWLKANIKSIILAKITWSLEYYELD